MKQTLSFLTTGLIPFLGLVLLLSSCAPTPSLAPSGALKDQLFEIKQQQQEQATQLQQLQQQLGQLQQQISGESIISAQIQGNLETPGQPLISVPLTPGQEAVSIAASASSYLAAFSSLAAGQMPSAEIGFQEFLRDFPAHQYSPNARYWLASAQLSQGKTNLAIGNLRQIIANPNARNKAPAALTQLAHIYRQEGLQIQADNVLEQLRNSFPESQEAQQIYRSDEPTN
ncbi:MAG: tetratricopeptide repeat protein [Thermodesulfobacteriota bacterium]|nr:tetratricopeptide repeat protein [Thermodesulfobacteriota bacterium]